MLQHMEPDRTGIALTKVCTLCRGAVCITAKGCSSQLQIHVLVPSLNEHSDY
jgi:hypothetical protein